MTRKRAADEVIDLLPAWITTLIQINGLIGDRMGLVATDFHCLHTLHRDGPATASLLSRRVGLTPGSTSRMVDRLEVAGCVRRVPDRGDRRRVLIEPTAEGIARVGDYYAGLTARTREDLAAFSEDELRTLLRFIAASKDSAAAEIDRLRAGDKPA